MANMSYCRFGNTALALKDCLDELEQAIDEGKTVAQFRGTLSAEEQRGFDHVLQLSQKFLEWRDDA